MIKQPDLLNLLKPKTTQNSKNVSPLNLIQPNLNNELNLISKPASIYHSYRLNISKAPKKIYKISTPLTKGSNKSKTKQEPISKQHCKNKSSQLIVDPRQIMIEVFKRCKIIKIEELPQFINLDFIFNIFSQFGNLLSIQISKKSQNLVAYIHFAKHEDAILVKDNLDGLNIFDQQIGVSITKYTIFEEIELYEKILEVSLNLNLE